MIKEVQCNQSDTRRLAGPLSIISGLCVALCCEQIQHSTVPLARSALVMESPIAEPTQSFHPCNHSHFVHGPMEEALGDWGKWPVDIYRMCHLLHLKIKCLLCSICCLASFTWATDIFRVYAHPEKSFHIPLPQASLSPIFQTCFFQVPDIQPNCTTVHIMKVDPHFWPSLPPNKVNSACTPGSAY